jgi:dihydrofolate synthase/folylpolyglutamate synthase
VTFAELKTVLFARSNFGMKLGLERMQAALGLLGSPHRAAPVLHVAGSNGKGSTCAFTEASLRAAGLKTGLYTSPHLVHFCERIRIDGTPIPEETAAALLEEILARVPWALEGGPGGKRDGDGLTFFELVTLMAFLAFAKAGVAVMVIEVGLGGRLDATNVVEPLACAIAPLALEHTQYLGNTIEEIAFEKAGIIKRGLPAARVLARLAFERAAMLWRPGRDYRFESRDGLPFCYQLVGTQTNSPGWTVRVPAPEPGDLSRDRRSGLSLRGHHQRGNAALACALLELASQRGLPIAPEHAQHGLANTQWPGRLQLVDRAPMTFLDGAHNPHGAQALARALRAEFPETRFQLVFGALADKDLAQILAPLLPLAAAVHCCAPDSPRALPPDQIAEKVAALAPALSCEMYGSAAQALQAARSRAGESGAVLGCGSLYLVGELLSLVEERAPESMPSERLHARST